jgi:hypothetical protein
MAGDWLKMDTDLPEKPEVWQIAGMVGLEPDHVVGKLLKVWRWFDKHTESGNAAGVTYPLLDSLVGVTGFAEAMVFAGWLVQDGRNLVLPNFDRHNGKTAKNRALTAKRVAQMRNADVTLPALPREEKRREEKEQKKEQGATAPPPPVAKRSKRQELTFADWAVTLGDDHAIAPGDPVFAAADKMGLPADFVALAWGWFEGEYGAGGFRAAKKYADWRAVFRKAVAGNWGKLWAINRQGDYFLTTEGEQARRVQA